MEVLSYWLIQFSKTDYSGIKHLLKDISILLKYVSFLNLVSKSESILLQLYQRKVYDWKYRFHLKGICIPEIRAESSSLLQKEYQ